MKNHDLRAYGTRQAATDRDFSEEELLLARLENVLAAAKKLRSAPILSGLELEILSVVIRTVEDRVIPAARDLLKCRQAPTPASPQPPEPPTTPEA